MREILNRGVTGLLVSHSVEQVRELCNKILWLDKGRQIAFSDEVNLYCDAYSEYLIAKKLPSSREDAEALAAAYGERQRQEEEKKQRTEAQRLQAILEEGSSSAALEAALNIIRKNQPELLR